MKRTSSAFPVFIGLSLAISLSSCKKDDGPVTPPELTPIGDLYPKANSYQVKKEEMAKITSLSSSSITFSYSPAYKAGDIVFSEGFDSKAPKGFLRKVTSVSGNTLNTTNVSLAEAFESGELSFTVGASSLRKVGTEEAIQGTYPLKYVIYDRDGNSSTTNDQLTLEGFLGMDGNITGSIKFHPLKINANFTFTNELDLNLVATGALSYSTSKTLFVAQGTPPIVIGGVVLTPELQVTFIPQVSVGAEAKSGINDKISFTSSVSYDEEWKVTNVFKNVFTAKPVEIQLNGNLKGTLMFEVVVYVYETIGPGVGIGPYLELNIDVNQNPWWSLYAGAEGNLLLKTKGIASVIPDYSYPLFDSKKLIAQAQPSGNPPTVTTLAAFPITSSGATLNGSVNPNGSATTAWFEYGTDSTLSTYTSTASQSLESGTNTLSVNQPIGSLSASTTYYYRVAANNGAETSRGLILDFTTSAGVPSYTEDFTTDVFANSEWSRSDNSVSINTKDGWLHIGSDGSDDDDFADKTITLAIPFLIETRMRLVSAGLHYTLPWLRLHYGARENEWIAIVYLPGDDFGWAFGPPPDYWRHTHTNAPATKNQWWTVKARIDKDGGELFAKSDDQSSFSLVSTNSWTIPNQIIRITFSQPFDAACDVDYLTIESSGAVNQ